MTRFGAAAGRAFIAEALIAAGLTRAHAEEVAQVMILADLRGLDSHGIVRLGVYLQRLKSGKTNPRPNIRIIAEAPGTALVDGDNGMGHLTMSFAGRLAIDKAAKTGIGWVGSRMSNHAGAAAAYAMMPLARDMIGLYLAVADTNHMAPWGGAEALLGTNPIAVAIPAQEEAPVVLDIATTVASNGRVTQAAERGETLPEGWVIDRQGQPVTQSARAGEGLLLPIGGYKGAGLSLVFALLAGALNGTPVGREAAKPRHPFNTGQAVMALDIARFGDVASFKRAVDQFLRDIRNSTPLPGIDAVRYPGQEGQRRAAERSAAGIPIAPALIARLAKIAEEQGIAPLALI